MVKKPKNMYENKFVTRESPGMWWGVSSRVKMSNGLPERSKVLTFIRELWETSRDNIENEGVFLKNADHYYFCKSIEEVYAGTFKPLIFI